MKLSEALARGSPGAVPAKVATGPVSAPTLSPPRHKGGRRRSVRQEGEALDTLHVAVSASLKQQLQRQADAVPCSLSDFVRRRLAGKPLRANVLLLGMDEVRRLLREVRDRAPDDPLSAEFLSEGIAALRRLAAERT